jgi:hypothetical protein
MNTNKLINRISNKPFTTVLTIALLAATLSSTSLGFVDDSATDPDLFAARKQLVASDGMAFDQFGGAVAISGNTALVGAPFAQIGGSMHQGAVYVFVRSGGKWIEQAKLIASDGAAGDEFGSSVALDRDTAVIGAQADDVFANVDQGTAYVFVRSGTTWTEQAHLFANDGSARDRDFFGNAVVVQGDTAIVGAFLNDSFNVNQGSAYVFARTGTSWSLQQHLFASDGAIADEFGSSVALDGNRAVVGAWSDTIGSNFQQGSAYVFVRSGTAWSQQAKLVASDGQAQDFFGVSIAISGNSIIVGADMHDVGANPDQGSAYVFARSGATWVEQQQLVASDGAPNDQFGHSVDLLKDTAVVGSWMKDVAAAADAGSAYLFTRTGSSWAEQQQLLAPHASAGDQLGVSVALGPNITLVGVWADDVGSNTDEGTAVVFVQPSQNSAATRNG